MTTQKRRHPRPDLTKHDPQNVAALRPIVVQCFRARMPAGDCAKRQVEQWTNQAARDRQLGTPSVIVNQNLRKAFAVFADLILDVYDQRVNITLSEGVTPS